MTILLGARSRSSCASRFPPSPSWFRPARPAELIGALDSWPAHLILPKWALVRTRRDGTNLVVEVEDDGHKPASVPIHLADRLGALGGRVERHAAVLRGEIPCA